MIWRKTLAVLTPHEWRRGSIVLALMCAMALFEAIGVASVVPFLAVLADPGLVESNEWLRRAYVLSGVASRDGFLIVLGLASFGLLVFGAVLRSVTFYAQELFFQMRRHSLASRLLEGYLGQPYEFFMRRHTGDLAKTIMSEVDMVIDRALLPMGIIVSQSLVLVTMFALLLLANPLATLVMAALAGCFYLVIVAVVRRFLDRRGAGRSAANRQRFQIATEALGAVKDIHVLGREAYYLDRFRAPSHRFAREMALTTIVAMLPKYAMEALAFGGIITAALVMLLRAPPGPEGSALGAVLPMLGLYAFAGYRMLPAIQNIYHSWANLRFAGHAVEALLRDFAMLKGRRPDTSPVEPLPLRGGFCLDEVSYHYPGAPGVGIASVSLDIRRGTSVGIVGSTGAGKTTLADVMLGLLVPQQGRILVDGLPITDANRRAWRRSVGYVPQDIYLADASIRENIAMGVPPAAIDQARVEAVCRIAQIHDHIVGQLPDGYATETGERGVRLSGGQRQRLGIARALYTDPPVIIFDEATSALDNLTENEVMRAVGLLSATKTVVLIAHRLSTVQRCDAIVVMEQGRVTGIGSYQQLIEQHPQFRRMAHASHAA
ncbi:ABC transporter ATP-binding protein [Ancylobacter terrae]|uniref:ABC transporter ATP-binding protein n=1 Tax=Ancylobacter sp. sgz301288 TaxID=3342077 RepID=UPI00385C5AEC